MRIVSFLAASLIAAGLLFSGCADESAPPAAETQSQTQQEKADENIRYIIARDVNFRDKPSMESNALPILRLGEPVYVLRQDGEWSAIKIYNGDQGYVSSQFLGSKENAEAKMKPTSPCVIDLDRVWDLLRSLPDGKEERAAKLDEAAALLKDAQKRREELKLDQAAAKKLEDASVRLEDLARAVKDLDAAKVEDRKQLSDRLEAQMKEIDKSMDDIGTDLR